jgi:citrate lyase subunit beta / citryl-CoA lyase
MQGRPRRSVLYMPGSNERALEKAKTIAVDALIFDLEDAVAPDAKPLARDQVCAAVKNGGYGGREVVIRVNALETPWGTVGHRRPARRLRRRARCDPRA